MDITHLIAHPEELNQETLYDLRRLVAVHPTYHAARILFLQNLFILHDPAFDRELRRAALLVPDRRVLFTMTQTTAAHGKANKRKKATETVSDSLQPSQTTPAANQVADAEAPKAVSAEAVKASTTATTATPTAPVASAEAQASSSANAGNAPSAATPEAQILPNGPRAPKKKYAAPDTTARLLDNFLDSTPQPLPKKQIKADPSTDYMSFLMQMEEDTTAPNGTAESAETSATPADEASNSLTSDERLFSLIDSFIASQEEGISLSEDPMIPEGILDDEEAPAVAPSAEATAPVASAAAQPEPTTAPTAEATAPVASAAAQPEPTTAPTAEASVPVASAAGQPEPTATSATSKRGVELSETLAQIYIKQQKYDRAIEVLNKISTDEANTSNPYLADQMRFLQKLALLNAKKSTKSK